MNLNRQHATAWVVALVLFGTILVMKARVWAHSESAAGPVVPEIFTDRLDRHGFDDLGSSEDAGSITPPRQVAGPHAGRHL